MRKKMRKYFLYIFSMIICFSPLEIDSDSSIEEFEDALNADEDIFAEPVPQNRLKPLSEFQTGLEIV